MSPSNALHAHQPRHCRSGKQSTSTRASRRHHQSSAQHNVSMEKPPISASPPPPYDEVATQQYMHPGPGPVFYEQTSPSELSLPVIGDNELMQNMSHYIGTGESMQEWQQPTERPYRQEQGRQRNGNAPDQPRRNHADGSRFVDTMIQSAALCDRMTGLMYEAWHEAFANVDDNTSRSLGLAAMTRRMVSTENLRGMARGRAIIDFKKTWMYANSRLPRHMPPVKLYLPTWQLVCSAATASADVYTRPRKNEKQDYIDAEWRAGTKAMTVSSRAVDDKNLIVIAIRGSQWNVVDWCVNFHPAPSAPRGFLDDEGNACHAGFLRVARAMISPIAARLRTMLEQDPSRASSSVLFTGHSAGGAVASLLYMHMVSRRVESELNLLAGCFKRAHCITFGTPPLSLLPLTNPAGKRFAKNVFLSFASEGDPVVRADRQYLGTLTRIITAPSPRPRESKDQATVLPPRWEVPPATLSNAGRLILLREQPGRAGVVEAVAVTDEDMRDVVFGDPQMHGMELYKSRVDCLAVAAVTGRAP